MDYLDTSADEIIAKMISKQRYQKEFLKKEIELDDNFTCSNINKIIYEQTLKKIAEVNKKTMER